MITLASITQFFAWCTLLNIGLFLFSALLLSVFSGPIKKLHSALLSVDPNQLTTLYFNFLARYKLLIIVFNLVPYLALRIII